MVTIEEVEDKAPEQEEVLPSQERLLDAEAIENAARSVERPTARMQLESLAKKLRREADALKRVEKSKKMASGDSKMEEKKEDTKAEMPASAATTGETPKPVRVDSNAPPPAAVASSVMYTPIDRFSFDAGEHNSPFVTVYVPLPGVGSIQRDLITCNFTVSSFDLIVRDLNGKTYRLFVDSLEKDIDPEKSKIIVKADKVAVKLAKEKTDYGSYDYWTKLTDKKKARKAGGSWKQEDPQKSIMDLMKQMYDEGDDNMKKVIGETMLKQQRGELGRDTKMGSGLGDLGEDI